MDVLRQSVVEAVNKIKGLQVPGSSTRDGIAYQPLPDFFGFKYIDSQKGATVKDVLRLIQPLIHSGKTLLDIGANVGYYSFMLTEDKDMTCTVIEKDQNNVAVIQALNEMMIATNRAPVNIKSMLVSGKDRFDYILMLNVHHWIEKELGMVGTIKYMTEVAGCCQAMFFQTAHQQSRSSYRVGYLKDERDIERYLNACGWEYVIRLGNTQPEEPRYLFYCHHGENSIIS